MSNYEFTSRIRYSETGPDSRLTIESLINYFQDCSTFQTEDSGAGLDMLKEQGLAWMLLSWQIEIKRLPRLYEEVHIGTIPYELKGMMGLRNYYMDTAAGERLAFANSVWALIDTRTMSPVRITDAHKAHYTLGEKLDMEYGDRKIRFDQSLPHTQADSVQIHANQLDSNHHVNNGRYVRIALDALIPKTLGLEQTPSESFVRHVQAEYKKQAHLGDELLPLIYEIDEKTVIVDLLLGNESCCTVKIGV